MKPAFKMIGRKVVPGGVEIILRHTGCGEEIGHLLKDSADLAKRTPIRCVCGFEVDFFCSNPNLTRRLLELVKLQGPRDRFDAASGPVQN